MMNQAAAIAARSACRAHTRPFVRSIMHGGRATLSAHHAGQLRLLNSMAELPTQGGEHGMESLLDDVRMLPTNFLRAAAASKFDPITHQRTDVPVDAISGNVVLNYRKSRRSTMNDAAKTASVVSADIMPADQMVRLSWTDGSATTHDRYLLEQAIAQTKGVFHPDQTPWKNLTEESVRSSPELSIEYDDAVSSEDGMRRALAALYRYGIVLITNTMLDPDVDGAGIAVLGAALGGGSVKSNADTSLWAYHKRRGASDDYDASKVVLPDATDGPMHTMYGGVWATSSKGQADGTSQADSAYGMSGIPLHTDMTYFGDPPGLQIFTMVQPAENGGETVLCDGIAAAHALKATDPEAFRILSTTERTYRSKDDATGWHTEASGPVIDVSPHGCIRRIRHNDLDRLPDIPPANRMADADKFYRELEEAHDAWDALLTSKEFQLQMRLDVGDTVVVANQRCLHARRAFESSVAAPRTVMGCYISQDELASRFRMEGFGV